MKLKTGKFPVKLRVTFKRVTKDYQTIFEMHEEDYKKLSASRISDELKFVRDKLKEIQRTAENAIIEQQNLLQKLPHYNLWEHLHRQHM